MQLRGHLLWPSSSQDSLQAVPIKGTLVQGQRLSEVPEILELVPLGAYHLLGFWDGGSYKGEIVRAGDNRIISHMRYHKFTFKTSFLHNTKRSYGGLSS